MSIAPEFTTFREDQYVRPGSFLTDQAAADCVATQLEDTKEAAGTN